MKYYLWGVTNITAWPTEQLSFERWIVINNTCLNLVTTPPFVFYMSKYSASLPFSTNLSSIYQSYVYNEKLFNFFLFTNFNVAAKIGITIDLGKESLTIILPVASTYNTW